MQKQTKKTHNNNENTSNWQIRFNIQGKLRIQ